MTGLADPSRSDSRDEELLADVFDELLQSILEGQTPDLATLHPSRPDLQPRIAKAWALACRVAGRREPTRPVLGGYEILRELGHGGMGTVYLARHQVLQREVAIKVLPQSLALSPRAKQRFLDEARALARLRHDDIVHLNRVLDHAEMLAFEMEFIDGPSLHDVVVKLRGHNKPHSREALVAALAIDPAHLQAQTPTEWAVRLGICIARALADVHQHGLVHRDVKPSNILLRRNGRAVLADFGLALDDEATRPASRGFAGTAGYAAPERLRHGDQGLDGRADVYGLAASLCELLTLQAPFRGNTSEQVLAQIDRRSFVGLRHLAPHISRDLDTVIGKALEPDPRDRYATAAEFADDLQRVLDFQPIMARPDGWTRRLAKWTWRNRRATTSALVSAAVMVLLSLPIINYFTAAAQARTDAVAALQAARAEVLSADILDAAWARSLTGAGGSLRHGEHNQARVRSLQEAIAHYDVATRGETPIADAARRDKGVVELVLAALDPAQTEDAPKRALATLPQPVAAVLAPLVLGKEQPEVAASQATPADRYAAGLGAFLLGMPRIAAEQWQGLEQDFPEDPLLDAGGALLIANDGRPERAFPRLFHAARAFPESDSLVLAVVESALLIGDLPLAHAWMERIVDRNDLSFAQRRRDLLAADLLAADGNAEGAAAAYRRMARAADNDPLPALRLAEMALQQGNWESAVRQFELLLRRWPDYSAARLAYARAALLRRDLPKYLEQVRYVLSLDLAQFSQGSIERFAAVLVLGGLGELCSGRLAEVPAHNLAKAHADATPLAHWLHQEQVAGLKRAMHFLAAFDAKARVLGAQETRYLPLTFVAAREALLSDPSVLFTVSPALTLSAAAMPNAWLLKGAEWLAMLTALRGNSLGAPLQRVRNTSFHQHHNDYRVTAYAHQVRCAGDLDGDTLPDLVIAAPTISRSSVPGQVKVLSLATGALLRTLQSHDGSGSFGRAIAVLRDCDRDYCDDLAIGAPLDGATPAQVQLRSVRTGEVIWTRQSERASFGMSLASLGDVNGDGIEDLVVGSPPRQLLPTDRGAAFILSGRDGSILREMVAERGNTWYGACVAGAGDLDGDGCEDVLVGGNLGNSPGSVTAISSKTGAILHSLADEDPTGDFGSAVLSLGDTTGDGKPEFVIAAPGISSRRVLPGRVLLVQGTGEVAYAVLGEKPGDGFGATVCLLPNWRQDGRPAIAIAARQGGPLGSGYVRVFDIASGRPLQTFYGNPSHARFGFELCALGDRDGDGYPDLGILEVDRMSMVGIRSLSFALHPDVQQVGKTQR